MNYLIAVLPDRIQAEAAAVDLEKEGGIPIERVTIVGRGYKTADEFGFIDPNKAARQQITIMGIWLIPFGFIAGVAFNLATGYNIVSWTGDLGNNLFGGLFGAIGGAMGAFFVGGGAGIAFGSGDALIYRNRLNAENYLVVLRGGSTIQETKARKILEGYKPEILQGYVDES